MILLVPGFLIAALAAAAGVIALHFIVSRQPQSQSFPTARFVPLASVRVTTISRKPQHLLLLLLRVLLLLCLGAAFARPLLVGDRRPVARVVLADVSRAVGRIQAVRDSLVPLIRPGDVLIAFDSSPRMVPPSNGDSSAQLTRSEAPPRLSPALILALRAAALLRPSADSIELVIVSPFAADGWDGATGEIRSLWPGRIRLIRVPPSTDTSTPPPGLIVRADSEDPIIVAAQAAGLPPGDSSVRLVRGTATPADSLWAATGRHLLIRWPAATAPSGWIARTPIDSAGALVADRDVVVFPFTRLWRPDPGAAKHRAVARWVDGEVAAIERVVGQGCIRDVAVLVPERGDVILRPEFGRLLRTLARPCGASLTGPAALPDLAGLTGTGPLAASGSIEAPWLLMTPLARWLLLAALLLALLEMILRRRVMA